MRFGDDLNVSPWKIVLIMVIGAALWWLILSHLPWV